MKKRTYDWKTYVGPKHVYTDIHDAICACVVQTPFGWFALYDTGCQGPFKDELSAKAECERLNQAGEL